MNLFGKLFGKKKEEETRRVSEPIVVPMFFPKNDAKNGGHTDTTPGKTTGNAVELRERIEAVLESELRPYLQSDGGDVELVDVHDDGTVDMHFVGACHGCPSSTMTLKMGIETTLKERIPEIKEVVAV